MGGNENGNIPLWNTKFNFILKELDEVIRNKCLGFLILNGIGMNAFAFAIHLNLQVLSNIQNFS